MAEIGGKEEVGSLLGDVPVAILDTVHKKFCQQQAFTNVTHLGKYSSPSM